MKIGITGSLSSGKTTASKILSAKRGPLFNADKAVRELYQNRRFQKLICRKFKIKNNKQIKETLRALILEDKKNIKKLEKVIHPLVRKKMKKFTLKNKKKKFLFDILNYKQMKDKRKVKFCDYVVVNEKNLNILKKNLFAIMSKHE